MYLLRFMSNKEKQMLLNHKRLFNRNPHGAEFTNSKGFCFMEIYASDINDEAWVIEDIKYHYQYLMGIVNDETGLVLEADKSLLKETRGSYADPYSPGDTMCALEYCCDEYSLDNFTPIYEITKVDDDDDMQIRRIIT